nr:WhiB family transcriptional regulator [Streptomyces thermoviolaceus]
MVLSGWSSRAACTSGNAEALFADDPVQRAATAVCADCPVRTECLAYALDNRIHHGVWGGMTERERRALLRSRPAVPSWQRLLDTEHAADTPLPRVS